MSCMHVQMWPASASTVKDLRRHCKMPWSSLANSLCACADVARLPELLCDGRPAAPLPRAHCDAPAPLHGRHQAPPLRAVSTQCLPSVLLPQPCPCWGARLRWATTMGQTFSWPGPKARDFILSLCDVFTQHALLPQPCPCRLAQLRCMACCTGHVLITGPVLSPCIKLYALSPQHLANVLHSQIRICRS